MIAVITRYGDMAAALPTAPDLALLDLLRAYAHDCLHYGSYRRYQLRDGQVIRTQYGINHRRSCGRTYSIPDRSDSTITRNLGVVMEGACDREARRIARKAAALHGVEITDRPHQFAFRDVTGQLDRSHLAEIEATAATAPDETQAFLTSLGRYETTVNRRYAHFLADVGEAEADELHDTILRAVISGNTAALGTWLDSRHGPGAFAGLFLSSSYFDPDVSVTS